MVSTQKALYNSLRFNWLQNQDPDIEPWKIEDLRIVPIEMLFSRLQMRDIILDRASFLEQALEFDSPEEMHAQVLEDSDLLPDDSDQLFLIIFEIWRRLIPEKRSVSVICDELDYQIELYERNESNQETLDDALNNLLLLLQENTDRGMNPQEIFSSVLEYVAHDFEQFICDFIADRIDMKEYEHAQELLDQFFQYVIEQKWFFFLQARLFMAQGVEHSTDYLQRAIELNQEDSDIDLDFEILAFCAQEGKSDAFAQTAMRAMDHVESEEDFQDLLALTLDFFKNRHKEKEIRQVETLLQKRKMHSTEEVFDHEDADKKELKELLQRNT